MSPSCVSIKLLCHTKLPGYTQLSHHICHDPFFSPLINNQQHPLIPGLTPSLQWWSGNWPQSFWSMGIFCEMNPASTGSQWHVTVASPSVPKCFSCCFCARESGRFRSHWFQSFSPHPETVSTSSSDTELLRNCLCSGKDTDSRNDSSDI